jgi:hypothetical protein
VNGPGLVCFKYSALTLQADERVTGATGSAESEHVQIAGPRGQYEVGESEIFATPKGARRLVLTLGQTKVYRIDGPRKLYAIYGPTSFSDGEDRLVVLLSGEALRADATDAEIYRRFEVRDPATLSCGHIFTYSWEAILGLPRSTR